MGKKLPPFQKLLDRHQGDVIGFLVATVGPQEAEDCFQETFLAALRAYPKLDDDRNLRGWLLTIAHRKAIDHHRARKRRAVPVGDAPEVEDRRMAPGQKESTGIWKLVAALPTQAAGRGRAALRLRPPAPGDRRRDRHLGGGRPAQRPRGSQTTQSGTAMSNDGKGKTDIERSLREAASGAPGSAEARAEKLIRRAEDERLLDVAYAEVDTPVGQLVLAATRRGLVRITFPVETTETVLEQLSASVSPRILESPERLDDARRELDRYFEGKLQDFDLPLDWQLTSGFYRKVLRATARIPYGKTRSYTEMATKAGSPRAVRATGTALGSNPLPIVVPCHRVLRSGGALGGYGGGLEVKQTLLELEGALEKQG